MKYIRQFAIIMLLSLLIGAVGSFSLTLAAQGHTGMVAAGHKTTSTGDASLVYSWHEDMDTETYSVSAVTGNAVTLCLHRRKNHGCHLECGADGRSWRAHW